MARFIFSAFADEASKDIHEQIAACKENGITHIELRGVNGKNISEFTVEEAEELKEILDENGISVSSIGSYYGKWPIADEFEEHFEAFKNTVAVANELDAEYIRIFSFYFSEDETYEEYKDEVFARLKMMTDYACKKGVLCCHENERGIYGETDDRCLELHEHFGEKLGCIFDPANYILCGVDTLPAYEKLKNHIVYFHIKDAQAEGHRIVPSGDGDGHIEEILNDFKSKELKCFLSVEPHLKVFAGLEKLEQGDKVARNMDKFVYSDNKASFAAACAAIHKIVEKIQPLRLGILGVGNMGSSHVGYYLNGQLAEMRITAVADINPERLSRIAYQDKSIKLFATSEELINSGECDAVVIATPHYLHPPLAIYALEKGLHVLTEKPAGVYTKQVREMNEAAAKSDKVFAIMYNQRTDPAFRKLREIVQGGEYGEMRRFSWLITNWYRTQSYYNSGGWRATWVGEGGGVLLNQCPHNLDLWQWICGMPNKIQAFCHEGKWHNIEVEDDVTIYCEYANGATGVFITSTADAPGTNRLEITMDKGKLVCENGKIIATELEESLKDHLMNAKEGFARPKGKTFEPELDESGNNQHVGVLNAFAANILRGEPLVARGEEGINGLSISNAAHLSSWLGRPVEIPVDEDLFFSELQKKIEGSMAKEEVSSEVMGDMSSTFNN